MAKKKRPKGPRPRSTIELPGGHSFDRDGRNAKQRNRKGKVVTTRGRPTPPRTGNN